MLQEPADELDARQRDVAGLMGTVIAITESNEAVVDGFQAAVGDGDAEDVAGEIVEDLFSAAGMFRVNDPVFLPEPWRHTAEQSRLFQTRTDFGREDHGKSFDGDEETPMLGFDPGSAIGRKAAGRDEHVNMGMKEHGARPGMKDGK